MRYTFNLLSTCALLAAAAPAADLCDGPAPVIRIYREMVKPGRQAAHEKAEGAFVRAMTKAKFPVHYIGMTSVTGGQEAWFVEAHDSFAAIEQADRALEVQPLKGEMEQAVALDSEHLNPGTTLIGIFRPDLSYGQESLPVAVPKARYFSVGMGRLKPASEERLTAAIKTMTGAYAKAKIEQPIMVYQIISGAPGRTYVVMEPMASLGEWDKFPEIEKAVSGAIGEDNHKRLHADFEEIFMDDQDLLFAVNPRMSYVSKPFASVDPAFWSPKPAPAKPAKKDGQQGAQ